MKEKLQQNSHEKYDDPNWVNEVEAKDIIEKIRLKYSDVEVSTDEEHFIIGKGDKKVFVPRWKKISTSSDGKNLDGKIGIFDELIRIIEEK